MASNYPHLQVTYLPWLQIHSAVSVGPVDFWPFPMMSDRVPDPNIRNFLGRYFRSYVKADDSPVDSLTICSLGAVDFRELSVEEHAQIEDAVNALAFAAIGPTTRDAVIHNRHWGAPPSAERFMTFHKRFQPHDDFVGIIAGKINRTMHGGFKVGEISFHEPFALGGSAQPDAELLEGLGKALFGGRLDAIHRNRLARSLEWFKNAHTEIESVSELSIIVMIATALEILLNIDKQQKGLQMADILHENFIFPEPILAPRSIPRPRRPQSEEFIPLFSHWALDFYKLRNAIVHGDEIDRELLAYQTPHRRWHMRIVAALVYWEWVVRMLYEHNFIGQEVRNYVDKMNKIFNRKMADNGEDEFEIESMVEHYHIDDLHMALGWSINNKENTE